MQLCAKKSAVILLALAAVVALAASPTAAQEPLRWKFNAGDKFEYDTVQDTTINVKGSPLGDLTMKSQQQIDMTWEVLTTNEDGEATIRQKVDRVRATMTGPMGQGVEYDSDAKEPPVGGAAMVAGVFEAMKKGDFELILTARGELKKATVPEEVLTAFKNSPQAAQMGDQITAEAIQKMIMQDVIVLPEKAPAPGETWTAKTEMNVPAAGKQTVDTTYKYEGTKEIEGANHAVISAQRSMSFAKDDKQLLQLTIKDQSSSGEALFNIAEGRLGSMSLKHNITMNASAQGQTIEQQLDQSSQVTVKPVDAETQEASATSQEPAESPSN